MLTRSPSSGATPMPGTAGTVQDRPRAAPVHPRGERHPSPRHGRGGCPYSAPTGGTTICTACSPAVTSSPRPASASPSWPDWPGTGKHEGGTRSERAVCRSGRRASTAIGVTTCSKGPHHGRLARVRPWLAGTGRRSPSPWRGVFSPAGRGGQSDRERGAPAQPLAPCGEGAAMGFHERAGDGQA